MKKKPIIAGLVLVLLLAAGAGAFFYLKKGASGAHGSADATAEAESHKTVPVKLPFLPVPVIEQGELRRYAIVGITLETAGDTDAAAVKADLPRVVDAFLDALHSQDDGGAIMEQTTAPASLIPRLQTALNKSEIGRRVRGIVISPIRPTPR